MAFDNTVGYLGAVRVSNRSEFNFTITAIKQCNATYFRLNPLYRTLG